MNLLAGRGETMSGFRFSVGEFEDIQQNEVSSQRLTRCGSALVWDFSEQPLP
jgi:hypothetical protein